MWRIKYLYQILCLSVFFILISCQNDSNTVIDLCDSGGLYSCICDEAKIARDYHMMRVMCSFQNITKIDDSMRIPNNTSELDFSVNNIENITYAQIFDNMNIVVLRLNRNQINKIHSGSFADLSNLRELHLSENRLDDLDPGSFHGIHKLKKLYLFDNKLTTLREFVFQGLPELEVLSLSDNDLGPYLSSFPDFFSKLALNPNINTLYLNNINISTIPVNYFNTGFNLKKLYLKKNPIYTFPQLVFTLEILDISNSKLSSLQQKDFVNLPAIKELYLNDLENLTKIEKFTFLPMHGLKLIQLQNCKRLQNLDKDLFGVVENGTEIDFPITEINLMGSGLITLDEKLLPFISKLSKFDIRSNPWICDCRIKWFLGLQLEDKIKEQVICERPPNLQGKPLYSLKPEDFVCRTWNRVMGFVTRIVIVVLCLGLAGLAAWLVFLWPPQGFMRKPHPRDLSPSSPYSRMTVQTLSEEDELRTY